MVIMLYFRTELFLSSPKIEKGFLAVVRRDKQFFSKSSLIHSYRHNSSFRQCQFRMMHASTVKFSSGKFIYGVTASFTAKNHNFNSERDVFHFDSSQVGHTFKNTKANRPASGQDAFFVSRVGNTSDIALGIADGVGGWGEMGVDPADFAHGICENLAHAASTYDPETWGPKFDPQGLLQRGYDDLCRDDSVTAGSSTACVVVARENGLMEIANLGDSGFLHLSMGAIHSYSNPQTHDFNTPYQLSIIPKCVRMKGLTYGAPYIQDSPTNAEVSQSHLRNGDVLVLGSDGIWDNLSGSDTLNIVTAIMLKAKAWEQTPDGIKVGRSLINLLGSRGVFRHITSNTLQSSLAVNITAEAKAASMNEKRNGPFAIQAKEYFPEGGWTGGKVDDICVIVAVACEIT